MSDLSSTEDLKASYLGPSAERRSTSQECALQICPNLGLILVKKFLCFLVFGDTMPDFLSLLNQADHWPARARKDLSGTFSEPELIVAQKFL